MGATQVAKRSISDQEIGLIKALAIRKMANKDIQFLFNRPDRPVNSGRISNIVAGKYGDARSIPPSPDAQVDAFLKHRSERGPGAAENLTASDAPNEPALRALFRRDACDTWHLIAEEGERHECKASFGFKHPSGWLRAIAALANNRGGFVWFGIQDKAPSKTDGPDQSYAVLGLSNRVFQDADPVEFTKLLKSTFDPTPRVQKRVLTFDGLDVGVLHVEIHPGRPIIATRRLPDDINEGDIFYRYPAQSSRIKYSDLRTLLDERDAHARQQLLPMVERLIAIGPRRSLIADLDQGLLGDGQVSIQIDRDLAQQLQFIKEGEFDERAGAPALRLIGDVSAAPDGAPLTRAGIITRMPWRRRDRAPRGGAATAG